jgi:hypothetical protein
VDTMKVEIAATHLGLQPLTTREVQSLGKRKSQ